MDSTNSKSVDPKKLEEFVMKAVVIWGSSLSAIVVILGEKLGLYKALQQNGHHNTMPNPSCVQCNPIQTF
jgi:hypothetical protein